MSTRMKIAFVCYLIVTIAFLYGLRFFLIPLSDLNQLLDLEVIKGAELEPGVQILMLALVRASGVGAFGVGMFIIILLFIPFRKGTGWARWAIPGISLTLGLPYYAVCLFLIPVIPMRSNVISIFILLILGFVLSYKQDG